jgi:hypothetical protein
MNFWFELFWKREPTLRLMGRFFFDALGKSQNEKIKGMESAPTPDLG